MKNTPNAMPTVKAVTCNCPDIDRNDVIGFKHPPGNTIPRLKSEDPNGLPQDDEQIGETFRESFTSMAYNVTAVAQVDSDGFGPAYLLNGLSDTGYWYQVGLSYNWNPPYSPGTGFDFSYEVWNASGNQVLPAGNPSAGLLSFSGPVNSGDTVLLNLYFGSGSNAGQVVMLAIDYATGASASETYSAEGGSQFVGDTRGTANSHGFFTGLMTEEYHYNPYYGGEQQVNYSNPSYALTSAWMWIDEYNVNTSNLIFSGTSGIVDYTNPNALQSYTLDGAVELTNGYSLTTGQSSQALLTVSYSTQDASVPSSNVEFSYYSNGVQQTTALTPSTTTALEADVGSSWQVTSTITGLNQEWVANESTSGTVSTSENLNFLYYHEYNVSFSYQVVGGGSNYSAPQIQYFYLGKPATTKANSSVWVDAATSYSYPSELSGSTSSERWVTNSTVSGIATYGATENVEYTHQLYVNFTSNPQAGGSVMLSSGWYNAGLDLNLSVNSNASWQFESWMGHGRSSYNGTDASQVILLSTPVNETANFYVGVTLTCESGGSISYSDGPIVGSVSSGSSITVYVPPGSSLTVSESPSSFLYQFNGWKKAAVGTSSSISLTPAAPSTVEASFGYSFILIGLGVVGVIAILGGVLYFAVVRRRGKPAWVPIPANAGT